MNTDSQLIAEAYESLKRGMTNTTENGLKTASPAEKTSRFDTVTAQKNVAARFKQNGWTPVTATQYGQVFKKGSFTASLLRKDMISDDYSIVINGEDVSNLSPVQLDDLIINPRSL